MAVRNFRLESSPSYRPDIDGLRAVAVLSVVLFHLELPLHGGFVGVDIFFTISGFLIGSIILRQTESGRFTFAGFYERRIRRIFPALFAMLLASSILALVYLLPIELVTFAKSLIATAFSVSNVFFWLQSGYFDAPASETPLLHTWSLAVEEQFYVFLPIFLVLLRRWAPRRIETAVYTFAAVSFLISAIGAYKYPSASFYLPHTRAWELLLGTFLAMKSCPKVHGRKMREAAGIGGAILIGGALFLYKTSTPFPGLAAVAPCLGTALIIAAGSSGPNLVGRALSLKPVVFVGLISYSLYLWHWPFMVFYRFGFTVVSGLDKHQFQALWFTLSFAAAVLSWRFIELPFRNGALRMGRRVIFPGAALVTLVVAASGATLVLSAGMPSRFTPQARAVASYIDNDPVDSSNQSRNGTCFITSRGATLRDYPMDVCLPDKPHEESILVFGDSHAAALWWGLDHYFSNANVMQATASGCKPVLVQRPRQFPSCTEIMDYILKVYLPTHRVAAVLIAAHWDDGDIPGIGETVTWLQHQNIPVILLGPIVQYDSSLPRLLAMSLSKNDPQLPKRHLATYVAALDRRMAALAHDTWHVPYISMFRLFCRDDICTQYAAPNVPLQSDYGHLTKAGSILAARRMSALGILPVTPPRS
jgi:peptidoglycan/LPS O-acetylase OafA/YrhL